MTVQRQLRLRPPLREIWNLRAHVTPYEPVCFQVAHGRLLACSNLGLFAVDTETARRLWTYPDGANPYAVFGGSVITWAGESELQLVDLDSGWPRESFWCPRPRTALLVGEVLLCGGFDGEHGGERIYGCDLAAGRHLWTVRTDASVACLAAGDGVLTCTQRGYATSVTTGHELSTGRELWRREGEWGGAPVIQDGRAIGSFQGRLVSLRLADGGMDFDVPGAFGAGCLYEGRYYCCAGEIYRVFDAGSGKLVHEWNLRARLPKSLQRYQPKGPILVTDTHVFRGSEQGALFGFDRETGEYTWRFQPKSATVGHLVSDGERLYYVSGVGRLSCLAPAGKRT